MNLDEFENEIETAVTEPDSDEKTEWLTALIAIAEAFQSCLQLD